MEKNEAKKELSKLTGIDMFNPKYRDLFNRIFDKDAESEVEETEDTEEKAVDEKATEDVEKPTEETPVEEKVEDIDKAEDEREIDKIEEDKAEDVETKEEKAEEVNNESEVIGEDVEDLENVDKEHDYKDDYLDAKIELELIKNGVSPDRLGSAKKMAKYEIHSIEELNKIHDLIKEYPEWVRSYNPENIGMPVDEKTDDLTEEEKRLKEMGINPRD